MHDKSLFQSELTNKIAGFLTEIGIEIISTTLDEETFLPGILVENGKLLVDEEKLTYPGDLLHEAGHLAIAPSHLRGELGDKIELNEGIPDVVEVYAIAWSYAACVHLGIAPEIVFHDGGYRGKSEGLLFSFSLGVYIGSNGLEEAGLTFSPKKARELGVEPYPKMQKWLRD